MSFLPVPCRAAALAAARPLLSVAALFGLLSCGGGGGGGGTAPPTERAEGVYTGFATSGNLDWTLPTGEGGSGGDGGVGVGADGDGGVGAGGDFGQFRNALMVVKYPDGTPVGNGQALTDTASGMVTIKTRKGYQGPLYLELRGAANASYYEEGKDTFVPFPADKVIRVWIPKIDKNIGLTPFTEAAYRLLTEGSTAEKAAGAIPTATEIAAANNKIRALLNQQFPTVLAVDDITRLPFIKSPTVQGQISTNPRGIYGLVNGAFSKQAAMFNPGETAPTLAAIAQLSEDLLDGRLDGLRGTQPAVPAAKRTYDTNTLTGELTSALAEQSERFGTQDARGLLPKVVNFGSSRYEGYLFDASLKPGGEAVTTVTGWVSEDKLGRPIGSESARKLPGRVFGVYGNLGHGGVFLKANAINSQSKLYGFGDNIAGELGNGSTGLGNRASAGDAVEIAFPTTSVVTHVAGGFGHTVVRMADGTVYTWGDNSYSQLGQGVGSPALVRSETPVQVTLPLPAIAVAASNTASYALLEDGRVFSWGSSWGFGLLGDGVKTSVRNTPGPVLAAGGELQNVVQIVARDNDVMVTRRDGTVWTWGSFPSEAPFAYTDGDVAGAYRGGSPLPTQIAGLDLQPGVQIRKILAEQGLFVVLTDDGVVYTWGVHFDITAQGVLRDLSAIQVLGLPKVRDLMPGGFIGYGSRPFDRLTAMAIDYGGNMWKVRGRVAEQFDPAKPAEQHRPLTQGPRADCASCHTPLTHWPLVPPGPAPTTTCVPPTIIHGDPASSLIHQETQCELCHNPARKTPTVPTGWLDCKPPTLPPRPKPTEPPVVTTACTQSVGHVFTPPGTVCSSCHNSIIARPLQSLTPPCAQPNSADLTMIATTARISNALDNANLSIAAGSATSDTTPTLVGTLSAGLTSVQSLVVRRNGTVVGTAVINGTGTGWTFADSGAGNGPQAYSARVEASATQFGANSNTYSLVIDTVAPTATPAITGALGDGLPIAEGHATGDTTPALTGTLSASPAAGEFVQLLRNGTPVNTSASAAIVVTGTNWSFTEPAALIDATYVYTARVVDAANNLGALSAPRTLLVKTTLPTCAITGAFNINGSSAVPIASGSATADTTPTLEGTVSTALLAGQSITILRGGTPVGTATANTGTTWTYTDAPVGNATHSYTARVSQGPTFAGLQSAAYVITVDTVAPGIVPTITGIVDQFLGVVAPGGISSDDTPVVTGSLPAALGAGESVQVLRNSSVIGTTVTTTTSWSYQDSVLAQGATYSYNARVIDAAGNTGTFSASRSVVIDTQQRTAGITAAFNNNGASNVAIPSGSATSDATPLLQGNVNATLLPGQWVRVLRDGQNVSGQITPVSGAWSYTDSGIVGAVSKTYAYTARVESANFFGTQSSPPYSILIDTQPPATAITITARSISVPKLVVPNGIPVGDAIDATSANRTDTDNPLTTLSLSSPLLAGESLLITRTLNVNSGAGPVTVTVTPSLGACSGNNSCFQFLDLTKNFTIGVGYYDAPTPNLPFPVTYTARVVDAVGNLGPVASKSWDFNYFDCNQARATAAASKGQYPIVHASVAAGSGTNCSGCHSTSQSNPVSPTPPGVFVAPEITPGLYTTPQYYWCRRL